MQRWNVTVHADQAVITDGCFEISVHSILPAFKMPETLGNAMEQSRCPLHSLSSAFENALLSSIDDSFPLPRSQKDVTKIRR